MSRVRLCGVLLLPMIACLAAATAAQAEPRAFAANGHFYEVVWADNFTWPMARAAAEMRSIRPGAAALPGHLATITSLEEDAFVSSLLPTYDRANWAVYLGGYQLPDSVEPGVGWQWVTGEPFVYANWSDGQPNDGSGVHENYLMYMGPALCPGAGSAMTIQWNDVRATQPARGFVVEYEAADVADAGGAGRDGLRLALAVGVSRGNGGRRPTSQPGAVPAGLPAAGGTRAFRPE